MEGLVLETLETEAPGPAEGSLSVIPYDEQPLKGKQPALFFLTRSDQTLVIFQVYFEMGSLFESSQKNKHC